MCQVDSEKEDLLFLVKLQEQAELSRMSSAPNRSPVLLHVRKITKFRNPWSPSSFLTSLPFGFTFLTSSGEENIKAPQTLKSLYLLLRVLNCVFFFVDMKKTWSCLWWYLLCGKEAEITFQTQIDYKWLQPFENHSFSTDSPWEWKPALGGHRHRAVEFQGQAAVAGKPELPGALATCPAVRPASTWCQPVKVFQFIPHTLSVTFKWC